MRDSVPWSISRPARNVRLLLAGFVALAVLLEVMAGTGLAYVAGFHRMRAALAQVDWVWLGVLCGSLGVSCAGYYHAYRAIFAVNDGPPLPRAKLWAVTVAGFSGFLAHGGGKLDQCALEAAGADRAGARVRVTALAGLEQGTLAIGGCAVWAGLAAFGYEMNGAALFVGFATGMVFTRRTGPLAGAGRADPGAARDDLVLRRAAADRGRRRVRVPDTGVLGADAGVAGRPARPAQARRAPGRRPHEMPHSG